MSEPVLTREETLRQECWNKALLTLGTSYVFSLRVKEFGWRIRLITVLGLIVPLLIGAIAATYGAKSDALVWTLIITGPVGIFQLVLSAVALVYKWEDQHSYSLESQTDNRALSDKFKKMAKFPPTSLNDFEHQYEVLLASEKGRTDQDDKYSFSDKENRIGMRYGLMMFERKCAKCAIAPKSMTPSNCPICGNF